MADPPAMRIGVSACLLGHEVRYDGGHKRDRWLADVLGRFVEWVPVCPEVELGLGTPRETLQLVRGAGSVRMLTTRTHVDYTDGMNEWARSQLDALAAQDLSGYVLKSKSPSCGMERVPLFVATGVAEPEGRGLFAAALLARFPHLPVEEEARLVDPTIRDHFVGRVFAYHRLSELFRGSWSPASLGQFHTAHEMLLLSHSPVGYRALGRLVAAASDIPRGELRRQYETGFMTALKSVATVPRHTDVLLHMAGHLKRLLNEDSRRELRQTIEDYRCGRMPLRTPLALIRRHAGVHGVEYLAGQVYLEPDRREIALRRHD